MLGSCKFDERYALRAIVLKCIQSVATWMATDRLKLNPAKSEFMWCATVWRLHVFKDSALNMYLPDNNVKAAAVVRNLGMLFDQLLTMNDHVSHLVCICFFSTLSNKMYAIHYKTQTTIQLMNSFVIFFYSNSTLCEVLGYQLNRVQSLLHIVAHLIYGLTCYDHVTDLKERMHWLHVSAGITFKCCLLVYKSLHGLAPSWITDLCTKITFNWHRTGLCFDACYELVVPRTKSKYSDRSFSESGPAAWNALPHYIWDAISVDIFKSWLKTHGLSYDRYFAFYNLSRASVFR